MTVHGVFSVRSQHHPAGRLQLRTERGHLFTERGVVTLEISSLHVPDESTPAPLQLQDRDRFSGAAVNGPSAKSPHGTKVP